MREVLESICLLTVAAVTLLVMVPGCAAEETPSEAVSELQSEADGKPDEVGVSSESKDFVGRQGLADSFIVVTGQKKEDGETKLIKIVPDWHVICKNTNPPHCAGEEISWKVIGGGLQPGQTMVIRDADPSNHCFPNVPVTIPYPHNTADSGPPEPACRQNPLGHGWEYVVDLYEAGQASPVASTDPGAIIFP